MNINIQAALEVFKRRARELRAAEDLAKAIVAHVDETGACLACNVEEGRHEPFCMVGAYIERSQ